MNHAKPAYQVIYDTIQEKIVDATYPIGSLLPSEMELEKLFKVSRTPVRQALKQLENDGYIYRVQGKGSFVANLKPKETWTLMSGFRNHYSTEWEKISVRTIEQKKVKKPIYSNLLGMGEHEELLYLSRIRYLNGKPIIYMEHYIRPIVPLRVFEENDTFSSVQQLLKDKADVDYIEVEDEIEAVIADPYIAGALQLPNASALLRGTRICYTDNKTPIEVNVFNINTDTWKYIAHYKF